MEDFQVHWYNADRTNEQLQRYIATLPERLGSRGYTVYTHPHEVDADCVNFDCRIIHRPEQKIKMTDTLQSTFRSYDKNRLREARRIHSDYLGMAVKKQEKLLAELKTAEEHIQYRTDAINFIDEALDAAQ